MKLFGQQEEIIIYSPVKGRIKNITKVKDEVFSKGIVGVGVAIIPTLVGPIVDQRRAM